MFMLIGRGFGIMGRVTGLLWAILLKRYQGQEQFYHSKPPLKFNYS